MDNIRIENNIIDIASFSKEVTEAITNSNDLFDKIHSLRPETKVNLYNKYINSKGPINEIRKELAVNLKEDSVDRNNIIQLFEQAKVNKAKQFTQYKNLFSVTYPFVIAENEEKAKETLKDLSALIIKDLGLSEIVKKNVVGYGGPRNTGSDHAWFAIYNKSHKNQETAKQLFFSIENGRIRQALYDRYNDVLLHQMVVTPKDFKYNGLLSFYSKYVNIILNDDFSNLSFKTPLKKTKFDKEKNKLTEEEVIFKNWIQENHKQITRPEKYIGAIKTISNDLKRHIEISSLFHIQETNEIKELYKLYFSILAFEEKNSRGNHMYSRAFDLYLEFMSENQDNCFSDIIDIIKSNKEGGEKETLILARLGQGRFKNSLLKKGEGCAISGYLNSSLLIASHIKPWSKCDNFEKVDPDNGLLLLPNFDKLFDRGLISFDDDGHVLISELFNDAEVFGIKRSLRIKLAEGSRNYMDYHRKNVFKK